MHSATSKWLTTDYERFHLLLTFGALISPTDPIAVLPIVKSI